MQFTKKTELACLKSEIDKLEIDKFETTSINMSKLSTVVKSEIMKKDLYGKKVIAIQTSDASNLVEKADYDTKNLMKLKRKLITT